MALSLATRQSIANLVQQKRNLQSSLRDVRAAKKREIESINYNIRVCSDKSTRAGYRNRKTQLIASYASRIESYQSQIRGIAATIKSYRGR